MEQAVISGPKGGLYVVGSNGKKKYLRQMSEKNRKAAMDRHPLHSLDWETKSGKLEIKFRVFNDGKGGRRLWMDNYRITKHKLFVDDRTIGKRGDNRRKTKHNEVQKGAPGKGIKQGVKKGGQTLLDEVLFKLLSTEGTLTCDDAAGISKETAKSVIKEVMNFAKEGAGKSLDVGIKLLEGNWLGAIDGTIEMVVLATTGYSIDSTLVEGEKNEINRGISNKGDYTGQSTFHGVSLGKSYATAVGAGFTTVEKSYASGETSTLQGPGVRLKLLDKTFGADATVGVSHSTEPNEWIDENGVKNTKTTITTKAGIHASARVSDREFSLSGKTGLLGSTRSTTHVQIATEVSGPLKLNIVNVVDENAVGILNSDQSHAVIARTKKIDENYLPYGTQTKTESLSEDRLMVESFRASYEREDGAKVQVERNAVLHAENDMGVTNSESTFWGYWSSEKTGSHDRVATEARGDFKDQVEYSQDLNKDGVGTRIRGAEVEIGKTGHATVNGKRTNGIEESTVIYSEIRVDEKEDENSRYQKTIKREGDGTRHRKLKDDSVKINTQLKGTRKTKSVSESTQTGFFNESSTRVDKVEIGKETIGKEESASVNPETMGDSSILEDRRTIRTDSEAVNYTPTGGRIAETKKDKNIFFTRTKIKVSDLNRHGNVIPESTFKDVTIELSVHTHAAVNSAKATIRDDVLKIMINTSGNKPTLKDITKHVGNAVVHSFTTSVAAEKLAAAFGTANAGIVAEGIVSASYALIHGDNEQLARASIKTAADLALESMVGETLPISYNSKRKIASGSLFGGVKFSDVKSNNLDTPIAPGVTAGIHFEKENTVFTKNGMTIHKKAYGVGGHAGVAIARVSASLSHGTEVAEPMERREGDYTIVKTWQRDFSGQLNFRLNVGDRQGSVNVLPAFKSCTVTWEFKRRADGKPLREESNLPLEYLTPITVSAPKVQAETSTTCQVDESYQPTKSVLPGTTAPVQNAQVENLKGTSVDPSPYAQRAMEGVGRHRKVMQNGQKTEVKRKNFKISKRTTKEEWEYSQIVEKKATSSSNVDKKGIKTELILVEEAHLDEKSLIHRETIKRRYFKANKHSHERYKPGERAETTTTAHTAEKLEIKSKIDGSDLDTRTVDTTLNGIAATRIDHDKTVIDRTVSDKLKNDKVILQETETLGWYETRAEHKVKIREEGDMRVESRRWDSEAGGYDISSTNGRTDGVQSKVTTKQDVSSRSDGNAISVETLNEEQIVGGVRGKMLIATSARIDEMNAESSFGDDTHTATHIRKTAGGFKIDGEEIEVSNDAVQFENRAAMKKIVISKHVIGHFLAETGKEIVTTADHQSAIDSNVSVQEKNLNDLEDIGATATEHIERETSTYEATKESDFLRKTKSQVNKNEASVEYLLKVTEQRDRSRSYDDTGKLENSAKATTTRYEQGKKVDINVKHSSQYGQHVLMKDTKATSTEDSRSFIETTIETIEDTGDITTTAPDRHVSEIQYRHVQVVETTRGYFTHSHKVTRTEEFFDADGNRDGEAKTEVYENTVLSGGASRSLGVIGSAIGSMGVRCIDRMLTDEPKGSKKENNQTFAPTIKDAAIMAVNTAEAFVNGTAIEALAVGGPVAQGGGVALAASAVGEIARYAMTTQPIDAKREEEIVNAAENGDEAAKMYIKQKKAAESKKKTVGLMNVVKSTSLAVSMATKAPGAAKVGLGVIAGATALGEIAIADKSDKRTIFEKASDTVMAIAQSGSALLPTVTENAFSSQGLSTAAGVVGKVSAASAGTIVDGVVKGVNAVRKYAKSSSDYAAQELAKDLTSATGSTMVGVLVVEYTA